LYPGLDDGGRGGDLGVADLQAAGAQSSRWLSGSPGSRPSRAPVVPSREGLQRPPGSTTERLASSFATTFGDDIFIVFSPMSSTQFQRFVSSWFQSADSLTPKTVPSALRSGGLCTYLYWPYCSMVFAADETTDGLLDFEFVAV